MITRKAILHVEDGLSNISAISPMIYHEMQSVLVRKKCKIIRMTFSHAFPFYSSSIFMYLIDMTTKHAQKGRKKGKKVLVHVEVGGS